LLLADFACGSGSSLLTVIANGFDRAALFGFFAARFFFRILGLLEDERIAAIVISFEIVGRRFTAQITVNALVIYVIFASGVFGVFICSVSHKISLNWYWNMKIAPGDSKSI
jgi:hypothetical protein